MRDASPLSPPPDAAQLLPLHLSPPTFPLRPRPRPHRPPHVRSAARACVVGPRRRLALAPRWPLVSLPGVSGGAGLRGGAQGQGRSDARGPKEVPADAASPKVWPALLGPPRTARRRTVSATTGRISGLGPESPEDCARGSVVFGLGESSSYKWREQCGGLSRARLTVHIGPSDASVAGFSRPRSGSAAAGPPRALVFAVAL